MKRMRLAATIAVASLPARLHRWTKSCGQAMLRTRLWRSHCGQVALQVGLMVAAGSAWANNLVVTNTMVRRSTTNMAKVKFDIAWDNSWRYTNVNHDAAWVFFKVQKYGDTSNYWQHVMLEGTGTNPPGYSAGTGTGIELIVPTDRVGLFVRRSAEGSGTTSVQNVQVIWNFASNGLTANNRVRMQILAVEMVYVAEGAFFLGSGGNEMSHFYQYTDGVQTTIPYQVLSETNAITVGTNVGNLYYTTNSIYGATYGGDQTGTISNVFPKGYAAFYCMKYEITEGQYTDFLNLLTTNQAGNRYSSASTGYRYTIGTNTLGQYTNGAPDRACSWLSWADGAAYADWAGLRPMTELEYEKACRGTNAPVTNEYAWGSTAISYTTAIVNDGTGTDTATGGNCNYNDCWVDGPYRAGIYATGSSSRTNAGASYWGIMELSGNMFERPVTVGHATGRLFTGLNGDGQLTASGYADVSAWPGTDAVGSGVRGGCWFNADWYGCVSDRYFAAITYPVRDPWGRGWRGVRGAPSGVGP